LCHLFQGVDLFGADVAISLGDLREEGEHLEAFLVTQVRGDLATAVVNGSPEGVRVTHFHSLAFVEEAEQDGLTLLDSDLAEIIPQELADKFHLAVHHPPVGLDNIRGHDEEREKEAVALPLVGVFGSPTRAVAARRSVRAVSLPLFTKRLVTQIRYVVEQGTQYDPRQRPQRAKRHKPDDSTDPFP